MTHSIDIVSASAGSGKTTRLAQELERAVIEHGISPDRIVATTFTRKAAAELIERGRQALLRAGRSDDAELFRAARIGTVNSVAGMLVSEFAFEAGISPGLLVLDQERASEAFRRSLSEVVTEDDLAELSRVASRFAEFPWQSIVQRIADAARTNHVGVEALAGNCDASIAGFAELLDPPLDSSRSLDDELLAALERAERALGDVISNGTDKTKKSSDALQEYQRALHRLRAQKSLPWPDWARLGGIEAASKQDAPCAKVRAIASLFLAHPGFREDCSLAMQLCFGLAGRTLSAYRRYKAERHAIDFVDQETIALELLEMDDVRRALADDVGLVLVDEFQDVSPLQLALFVSLSKLAPRSIWVGDQKQAIYGFRGADPALMESVVAEVLGGAEPETLGVGRRSRSPLVHLTNALFTGPFGAAGLPPSRVALVPASDDDPAALGPCVERWKLDARNGEQAIDRLSRLIRTLVDDAGVLVRDRQDQILRRARPGDIAILCRRGDTCTQVADRLADMGVAADVSRFGLLATPEGRAVAAGLRLWADPRDALARAELIALLEPTSSSIDALVDVAARERQSLPAAVQELLIRRDAVPFVGAIDAFDAVVASLELDELVTVWGRGPAAIANIDALRAHAVSFVRLARHHGGASSPSALVSHLRALASDGVDAQARVTGEQVVQVMTWHASKGLEWPIVVLFELDGPHPRTALGVHVDEARTSTSRLDRPLDGRTIRYWPEPFHPKTSRTPFHDRLRAHQMHAAITDRGEREEVRLLYVGWTRARDRIVLASMKDLGTGTLRLFAVGGGLPLTEPTVTSTGPAASPSLATVCWGGCDVEVLVRPSPDAVPTHRVLVASPEILVRPASPGYPPARLRPSDVDVPGRVEQIARLGPAIAAAAGGDPIALGSAIHGFLAADRKELDADDRSELAGRLLSTWGVGSLLSHDALLSIGERFTLWLSAQWPAGRVRHEWPVEHRLESGTVARGQADIVIEAADRIAVIDHKVVSATEERAVALASTYAGQLAVYANALEASSSASHVDTWIHLPLSGLAVRIAVG